MAKIINLNEQEEEMIDICDWDWCDFKTAWNAIKEATDEDTAWKAIYDIWQIRAKEKEDGQE